MGVGMFEVFTQLGDQVADGSAAVEFIGLDAGEFNKPTLVTVDFDGQRRILCLGAFTTSGQETSFNNAA